MRYPLVNRACIFAVPTVTTLIKNINMKKIITTIVALLLLTIKLTAQQYPSPMPGKMVHDFANVLSQNEEQVIEQRLRILNDTSSTQVTVVTVNDFQGETAAEFATELGHQWGVGQDGKDNGVVVLFKPKTLTSKGEAFIAVGYGLEGVLPDAIAKMIVENDMIPYFQQGKIAEGLLRSVIVISAIVGGEYSADEYKKATGGGVPVLAIIIIIVVFGSMFIPKRRSQQAYSHDGTVTSNSMLPWILLSMLGNGRGGGGYSGGGGFGGGFGGFGGGGFGGGGAGGSW